MTHQPRGHLVIGQCCELTRREGCRGPVGEAHGIRHTDPHGHQVAAIGEYRICQIHVCGAVGELAERLIGAGELDAVFRDSESIVPSVSVTKFCSNPIELAAARGELSTDEWAWVFEQAAAIGVLQLHLSGGEPTLRADLSDLVRYARQAGLYTNLITAGVLLDEERLDRLVLAGLDHVQLSLQGTDPAIAERIGGYRGGHTKKLAAAALVRQAGLPLTVNAVVHRQNLDQLDAMIALALELEAERLEVAHVQYYGWALRNRATLMPSRKQLDRATATVEAARASLAGRLLIDYVVPDYYARRPKPCTGGWGRAMLAITPQGLALPCHAAQTIPGLNFPDVRGHELAWIWHESSAFRRFRGQDWCRSPVGRASDATAISAAAAAWLWR